MNGAIAGDIIGSIYEHQNIKSKDFEFFGEGCRYTDDTVCTIAIAECLMDGGDFADYLIRIARCLFLLVASKPYFHARTRSGQGMLNCDQIASRQTLRN